MPRLRVFNPSWMISGKTHYEAAFGFEQDQVNIHNISLTMAPFKIDTGRQHFFDQKLILSTAGVLDVDKRSAVFAPVNITATVGEAVFESFKLGNLQKPLEDMTAKGSAKFDLARLAAMDGETEAPQPALAGNGRGDV